MSAGGFQDKAGLTESLQYADSKHEGGVDLLSNDYSQRCDKKYGTNCYGQVNDQSSQIYGCPQRELPLLVSTD